MFHKIKNISALPDFKLSVQFSEGVTKIYDVKTLFEKIADSDMVLIGIGEEFNESFRDIGKFPNLMSALEEVDINPSLEWVVPFLEHRFLKQHSDGKLIEAYKRLYELIANKNYFVVTTCIDENIKNKWSI